MGKLSQKYRAYSDLFNIESTDKLTPHRPASNHEIRKESGKKVSWGPLYGVSRDG